MNNLKVKYDHRHFETGEFISNGHWLARTKFVASKPTDLEVRNVDVERFLPQEIEGYLIDTRLVRHEIGSREKTRLFKTPQGTKVWLDEAYYSMFYKAFPQHELYAAPKNGPVVVMLDDEFLGLIMPIREDKTINVHLA